MGPQKLPKTPGFGEANSVFGGIGDLVVHGFGVHWRLCLRNPSNRNCLLK